ncbi:Major facilitator superfamily domain containing [Seminavis robusta]|uniref:Major facilitator superfamily domain containing n=1 Tax=Seminavis robusta TaxID=568900 RepID=A0A9N8HYC3_9STRA|nr:Major facilitator superfamily domain containing [Seminavis robusta]|eukprot:Sro1969_g308500.1 Major facilitator superfamily domain containing (373) ;mRNA; r:12913-14125
MAKFRLSSLVLLLAASAANAKHRSTASNQNNNNDIYRLGITPILRREDRNSGDARSGPAEAWVETFSMANKPRRSIDRQPRKLLSKTAFATSIAFLTGFADVFSFRMNRCYANMMTGNTIRLASALGEFRGMEALHLASMLFAYAFGALVYRSMVHYHILEEKTSKPHVAARTSASPVMLAMFALSDLLFYNNNLNSGGSGPKNVIPLALAFGLLNSATTDAMGGTITFALTGHVSKLSSGISDWFFATDPRKRRIRSATKMSARIMGWFVAGVLCGTWLTMIGSNHVPMEASGLTLPAFLVGEQNRLPIFSIIGIIAVALIQLFDRPLPNLVWDILSLMGPNNSGGEGEQRKGTNNNKADLSINLWPQSAN